MNHHPSLHHRYSRGITLIEVMFACGIAMFGLLVVVALIPLGSNELRIGSQTDRMASLGRNAVQEFDIRGMRDPRQWIWNNKGGPVLNTAGSNATGANLSWFTGIVDNTAQYRTEPQAYAIDPRFVTRHPNIRFPYAGKAQLSMPRLSLLTRNPTNPLANGLPLDQVTADHLFVARDDLMLLFPDDRTLLSSPNWGIGLRKRQYRGELSWMATVVPLNVAIGNQQNKPQFNDNYLLSIIIFSARNLSVEHAMSVDSTIANVAERATNINLVGGGYAGGEVKLIHPIPKNVTDKQKYAENVLKLQTSSWIMLSGRDNVKNPNRTKRHVRWYRVLNVGPARVQKNNATRFVTLQGADWELPNGKTQATIMEGVVGVFEKNIRLENSSLW